MELTNALAIQETTLRPRIDRQRGVLVGSRCEACGATSWPSRAICYICGAAVMGETVFPLEGRLLTYTTVWVERSGLEPPYTLGQVAIADGPVVFAHIRKLPQRASVPLRVRLVVGAEDDVPPFWFEPEEEEK